MQKIIMWLKTYKINNEYIKTYAIQIRKTYLFSCQYDRDGGWFRIFKFGIAWTKNPLFSVRTGRKKSLKIKNNYYRIIL
jgi:hypothetical protein